MERAEETETYLLDDSISNRASGKHTTQDRLREWLGNIGSGNIHPEDLAADLDILNHFPGVRWVDVTDDPNLNADLKPKFGDSRPTLLLGERIFRPGRCYIGKPAIDDGIINQTAQLITLSPGTEVTVTTTSGANRWRRCREVLLAGWQDNARASGGTFPDDGSAAVIIRRVVYSQDAPPQKKKITSFVIYQINSSKNPGLLGFTTLRVPISPELYLPYFNEVEVGIIAPPAGTGRAAYMDVYIDVEVL